MTAEQHVQSLVRGLSVIRSFDAQHPSLTLSEVATRTGMPRAAARRFLLTLVDVGYVRTAGKAFELTPRVLELGVSYLSALGLPEIAQPHLEALSAQVGESVSVAVLDGTDIVYVARAAGRRIMSVDITIGTRFPAYATGLGRVLIAALPEGEWEQHLPQPPLTRFTPRTVTTASDLFAELRAAREQGWAHADGELEEGLHSLAVALNGPAGLLGAINIATGPVRAHPHLSDDELLQHLRGAASAIEADYAAARLTR
jgi:IclR family pca regulon transcriptional regulator